MTLSEEDKKYILNEHLRNIHHISDKDYQERVWIRAEGPECDDYTESMCHFFDDGDPIIANYKDYKISDNQLSVLTKFRDVLDDLDYYYTFGPYFIYSPDWHKVTMMAKEVLEAFNYQK